MTGFVLVDKPVGPTSHDVVDAVRRAVGVRRVGHAGTLDPGASGLLVLAVGPATRLLRFIQGMEKTYTATGLLGITTSTLDAQGDVIDTRPVDVSGDDARAALAGFVGTIEQVPPEVSAIKIGGERAYRRAARGEEVHLEPRRVTVHEATMTAFDPPRFDVLIRCSTGTYVRSLVGDIGEVLGCGAHVTELRRTRIGHIDVADAVGLNDIGRDDRVRVEDALRHLPRVEVDGDDAERARSGQRLRSDVEASEVVVVGPDGAIGVFAGEDGMLRPVTVLGQSGRS